MSWFEDSFKGSNTGSLIGAGLGAIAGASSKGGGTSATNQQLDPRIASYIYGQDGKGGLLGDANSIYQQQMQQGGLNDMQRQGLDMRAQYLQSPQYTNSYQAMMNQGMGLLNSPIAGNPFTRSQQGSQAPSMPSGGYQYKPSQSQAPIYRPAQQQQQPAPQSAPAGLMGAPGQGGGNIQVGSGGGSSNPGGQGINNDAAKAALAAMAASENPALRMFSPSLAALLGLGGYGVAGQQADAMGEAGNKLSASQPLANLGIGTVSDESGNVRTISTPETVAAADRAMFGNQGGQGGRGYGNMGNGGYGGATGGYGGSYGSGSVGGFR